MTDVFNLEVLASKFGHPKGCSQNKDCQAKRKEKDLQRKSY